MVRTKGQKIPGLERKPKREGGYFDDLPYQQRERARHYFDGMIRKKPLKRLGGSLRRRATRLKPGANETATAALSP